MIPHSMPGIGEEEIAAASRALRSGRLSQGPEVEAFERECAGSLGRRHAVAVSSGTAALHLALLALDVGRGDTIAIPSYACAALPQAVSWCGATPLLCDNDAGLNADVSLPLACKARIAAHLFGAPAPVGDPKRTIEDIAQSIGGRTGRAGIAVVASYYATKMLSTGEGGMVLTDDAALAEEVRDRRDYDNRDDWKPRFAYKLTEPAAAMGRVQLSRLPEFLARRRELAEQYHAALDDLPLQLPKSEGHIYFRYVVTTPHRNALMEYLHLQGIEAKRPVHRPAHHYLGGTFPGAERAHDEALSLPIYPTLTADEVAHVARAVRGFFESGMGA